MRYDT